ncbi:hypothetical protein SEVIR_9G572401v4 [Setaria viridis]
MVRPTSDHVPILATLATTIPRADTFRFENACSATKTSSLPSSLPAWQDTARHSDAAGRLAGCLKSTRAAAKVWARRNRAPPAVIPNCKFLIFLFDYLEETRCLSTAEIEARTICHDRLALAIKERAAYWKQRGKQRAIREGDSTQFFHAHATQRMRRNHIRSIQVDGTTVSSHQGKVAAITAHFKNVMASDGSTSWDFDLASLYQGRPIASDALTAEITATEALHAVRAMNCSSAPGPDGFGPSFYRAAWPTAKQQVMELVNAFCQGTVELERINRSYMILLPKKPGATKVTDYRPICLQNCSVKIMVKALTTRLQAEISALIDLDQTGFLRQAADRCL